jgi:hypothetical protein
VPATELTVDDLARTLLLHDRGDRVARIDGPEQIHIHDKLQERRVKGAGPCIHRPTATAARIRDQDIDPTPSLDDPRNHRRYRLVVGHVDLDTQIGAVRCLYLDHLEAFEHRKDIVV